MMDDVLVYSSSWEDHLMDVLQKIKEAGLTICTDKCVNIPWFCSGKRSDLASSWKSGCHHVSRETKDQVLGKVIPGSGGLVQVIYPCFFYSSSATNQPNKEEPAQSLC